MILYYNKIYNEKAAKTSKIKDKKYLAMFFEIYKKNIKEY